MAGVTDKTDFRLLRFFTTTSLLAFLVVAALLGYVFRALSIDAMIGEFENAHTNLARLLANEIWLHEFDKYVRAAEGKPASELRQMPQIPLINEEMVSLLKGTSIFKIKLYNRLGMTIFSTDLKQIGEDKSHNAGVIAGLRGRTESELAHKDTFSTFEREVQNRDLVESYVPLYDPFSGKIVGVFEIYGDATQSLAYIGERQLFIVGTVIGLLALLYMALFIIVERAQSQILQQSQERQRAQQALKESVEELRLAATVYDTVDEAVAVTDTENRIVSVNPAFTAITGYSAAEVIGEDPKLLASGMHPPEFYREMWQTLSASGSWHGEIHNRHKNGKLYVEWLSIKRVCDHQGVATHYVAVFSDITERKAAEEHMQHLAHFDLLTGLANRTLFTDRLQQTIAKARRDKARLALMFIDLDEFKPVNDSLGHHIGDLLLKEVASRLQACLRRETDTVGRMGGDEFVVILPEIEVTKDALSVAEKILHSLNQPFDIAGHTIRISASIGVALFPEHGSDEKLLLKSADAAMYLAKEGGRNRLVVAEV